MKNESDSQCVSFELPGAPAQFRKLRWDAEISARGLRRLSFTSADIEAPKDRPGALSDFQKNLFAALKRKLLSRLKGGSEDFAWEEFDLQGAGQFHARVWRAMRDIPAGRTLTYAETAARAGSPLAFRACGQACGANRILVFIPCHRVVAANGLGGFGYGLEWKKKLLQMEGAR